MMPIHYTCINCYEDFPESALDFDMDEDPDDPSHQWIVATCKTDCLEATQ